MADISSMIRRVRARIHDNVSAGSDPSRPLYMDEVYNDALESAVGRINLDLDSSYSVAALPVKYEYLLELRGTINLCYVRGAEGASGDVEDFPNVPDAIVTVPQMTVQRQQMPLEGPKYWLRLAEKLDAEYLNSLARLADRGEEGAEIQQYVMTRMSLRTGRRTSYWSDTAIQASDLAASVFSGKVLLSWGVIADEFFDHYQIERSQDATFSTPIGVFASSDNHDVQYIDSPPSGSWYYRLKVVNSNDLASYSQAASVVV
jgi:hypothetical protein